MWIVYVRYGSQKSSRFKKRSCKLNFAFRGTNFRAFFKLLLRGQFNAHASNGERTLKEHCGERWGEAASRELRTCTYQPSGKWSLVTIASIEFYYFDDGETVLRAYRDSGEAKASARVGKCFQSFY